MSEITYKEIKNCDETVEVNAKALLRAYNDGLFDNLGNAHERQARNRLKDVARTLTERRLISMTDRPLVPKGGT